MTDFTIDDLLLLAEAMGWKRCDSFHLLRPGLFAVSDETLYVRDPTGVRQWNPYTSFSDAGMLMRALGIDLLCIQDDDEGPPVAWEGTDSSYRCDICVRVEGNTEAAQCKAICGAALQMRRAKG